MVLTSLLFLAPLWVPAAQDTRISTGPPTGVPPAAAPGPADAGPSPVQGDDLRVNTITTSAQNETSIAANPLDPLNWVAVANDYHPGPTHTGWYTTLDGGQTWTSGVFPLDPGFPMSGDPCVAFDAEGGVHVVCMMYNGPGAVSSVVVFNSADGGQTWGPSIVIGSDVGYDKPQFEVDLLAGPGTARFLVAWDHFTNLGISDDVLVSTSTDGQVWSAPQVISDGFVEAIGPDVAWGPGGEAYVMWADRGKQQVTVDRSFDRGVTWNTDVKVADYTSVPDPLPGSPFRMFDVFSMHADATSGPFSGRVYVSYHTLSPGTGQNRADVLVAASADQGATWAAPVKISSDGTEQNDQIMAGTVVDAQGNVNVCFYDQRLHVEDKFIWTWVSRSSDGGVTWVDTPVSDEGWAPNFTEFFGTFIGDYIDAEALPDGTVLPYWGDGRTGTQDVYLDVTNLALSTSVDTLSAATGGQADFFMNIGPNHSGDTYLLVASGSGSQPGTTFDGVPIPLNPDFWSDLSIKFSGTALFPNSLGVLDATGSANASLDTLGPFPASFVGTVLDFSAVVFNPAGTVIHATPPTRIELVP